eukprot:8442463-Alexandrium_andersonii.AAC.1
MSGPAQFKLRMRPAILHFLGSGSSGNLRRASRSSGELWGAPESLRCVPSIKEEQQCQTKGANGSWA